VFVDFDNLAAYAASDLAQLALLVGRGLVEGADAKVENGAFHWSFSHRTSNCVGRRLFAPKAQAVTLGIVGIEVPIVAVSSAIPFGDALVPAIGNAIPVALVGGDDFPLFGDGHLAHRKIISVFGQSGYPTVCGKNQLLFATENPTSEVLDFIAPTRRDFDRVF